MTASGGRAVGAQVNVRRTPASKRWAAFAGAVALGGTGWVTMTEPDSILERVRTGNWRPFPVLLGDDLVVVDPAWVDFQPWWALAGMALMVLAAGVLLFRVLAPDAEPDDVECVAEPAAPNLYRYLPVLWGLALAAGTLLMYGLGWDLVEGARTRTPTVLQPTVWGLLLALVFAVTVLASFVLIGWRLTPAARADAAWCAWANTLPRPAALVASDYRRVRKDPGQVGTLGLGVVSLPGPPQVGSLNGAEQAYGLAVGHPIGLPLTLGLAAARRLVNEYLKRAHRGPTVDEARRMLLNDARRLLVQRLGVHEQRRGKPLTRPEAAQLERDDARARELLQAVNDAL